MRTLIKKVKGGEKIDDKNRREFIVEHLNIYVASYLFDGMMKQCPKKDDEQAIDSRKSLLIIPEYFLKRLTEMLNIKVCWGINNYI